MKTPDGFEQSDHAQAAVEIDSRLLVGVSVTDAPNDKEQLAPTLAAVSPVIESVGAVAEAEQPRGGTAGPKIYAATERRLHGRTVQELENREEPPPPGRGASPKEKTKNRLQTKEGRELYAQREHTIGERPPQSFPKAYRLAAKSAAFGESASRSALGSRF